MRAALCLAFVTASLTASPAFAADALAQARAAMAQASFEKALGIADKALRSTRDPVKRGQLDLVRAECFHALRKTSQMKEALADALSDDPLAAFDADSTNPELRDELDQQRKAYAGRIIVSGSFTSDSAPTVTIDGVKAGKAPLTTRADVGKHRVTLTWPTGEVQKENIIVRVEADSTLSVMRVGSAVAKEGTSAPRKADLTPPEREGSVDISEVDESPRPRARWPWPAIISGGLIAIGGGVCLGVAQSRYDALTGGAGTSTLMLDRQSAMLYAEQGQRLQIIGVLMTVVGLVLVGAGLLGLLL